MSNNTTILLPILKQIPLFATLDESLHEEIIEHIALMYYPKDYTIFKENAAGDALYIIKKGSVLVYHEPKAADELPKKIATITAGGFFGEMALISEVPRNATVKTLEESEVFILSKDDFKKLLETNKLLAEHISSTVISRIKANNQ